MNRAKNIAKLIMMLTTILLLTVPRYVHAQNNGANPYLDSEHAYQVSIGVETNDREWVVTDNLATGDFPYTITKENYGADGLDWFEVITPAPGDGDFEQVEIYFDRDIFTKGTTYYLQYFEYEDHGSGKICVSARQFKITVTENTFYLLTDADFSQCNAESGKVHTYEQVDNDTGTELFSTTVKYTVTMYKDNAYDPDRFSFDAAFNETVTNFEASVTITDEGTASYTEDAGVYTVSVVPGNGGSDPFLDEVEVTLSVTFDLPVLDEHTPKLTVSNGQAVKDGTPQSITYDNETIYPEDPGTPGDREQIITINDIPATRNIGPGAGETASSASNPLQNSTHNYLVTMEDQTNFSGTWSIVNSDDVVMTPGTGTDDDYSITVDNSVNDVTATISYTESMAVGTYTILFEEENNTTNCSTVRSYEINLGEPLNVSVALADAADAERCPDVSGTVVANDNLSNATTTIIEYTVTLNTTGYDAGWSFDMGITSDVGFGTSDVDVAASGISVTGGTFSAGADNYTGSVSVAAGVTEVTIAVTYEGFYVNEHNLTMSLTNIEGTYNDEADDVNVSNIINAMPQPLALEGVD